MPRPLRRVPGSHDVSFVERGGWKGEADGELLALVEASFDGLVTSDGGIEFRNELNGRSLSPVVVPTNNPTIPRANAVALLTALDELARSDRPAIVGIDWKGPADHATPGRIAAGR